MKISFDEQAGTDFDWFGVDEEGLIGHFTTAGFKRLPPSVACSAKDLKLVTNYFENLSPSEGGHNVDSSSIASALQRDWKGEKDEERYLRSFVAMADKGLFSFDIGSHLKPDIAYFRVALPQVPITVSELPENIRPIVSRTFLKGVRLRDQSHVSYEATLLI